jgi:hypothetical protein
MTDETCVSDDNVEAERATENRIGRIVSSFPGSGTAKRARDVPLGEPRNPGLWRGAASAREGRRRGGWGTRAPANSGRPGKRRMRRATGLEAAVQSSSSSSTPRASSDVGLPPSIGELGNRGFLPGREGFRFGVFELGGKPGRCIPRT